MGDAARHFRSGVLALAEEMPRLKGGLKRDDDVLREGLSDSDISFFACLARASAFSAENSPSVATRTDTTCSPLASRGVGRMSGPAVKGMADLAVDASQSGVLNASNPDTLAKVLAEGAAEPLRSDSDDPELLIGARALPLHAAPPARRGRCRSRAVSAGAQA